MTKIKICPIAWALAKRSVSFASWQDRHSVPQRYRFRMMYWEYGPVHRRLSHWNDDMARIRATKMESEPRAAVIVDGLGPSASLLPPAGGVPVHFPKEKSS